jgi:hypothetical protein
MSSRDALAEGIRDLRRIYMKYGLYTRETQSALATLIRMNREKYPEIFKKIK